MRFVTPPGFCERWYRFTELDRLVDMRMYITNVYSPAGGPLISYYDRATRYYYHTTPVLWQSWVEIIIYRWLWKWITWILWFWPFPRDWGKTVNGIYCLSRCYAVYCVSWPILRCWEEVSRHVFVCCGLNEWTDCTYYTSTYWFCVAVLFPLLPDALPGTGVSTLPPF